MGAPISKPKCIFSTSTSNLKCEIDREILTCAAKIQIDSTLNAVDLFAIELPSLSNTLSAMSKTQFNLVPQNSDTNEQKKVQFLLTNNMLGMNQAGIQVMDMDCFGKLAKLLTTPRIHEKIMMSENESKMNNVINVLIS